MIHGLNFGRGDIPHEVRRLFRERIRNLVGQTMVLVGACQDEQEKAYMLSVANNGTRKLYTVQKRGWYGIYAG